MAEEIKKIEEKKAKVAIIKEVPVQIERYVELEDGTKVDDLQLAVLNYNLLRELLRRL